MRYSPRDFNALGIKHLMSHPCANLFAKPGTGKTAMTLTALVALDVIHEDALPALIIAPIRVARTVWDAEAEKWSHTKHLRVSKILGNPLQRRRALYTDADIYTINYENAAWLEKELGGAMPFKTIVADESSKLKGCRAHMKTVKGVTYFAKGGTVGASAVIKMGLKANRRINLTGTPSANGLGNLWAQQFFLDHGETLGPTHGGFQSRWFRQVRTGAHAMAVKWVPHAHSFDAVMDLIRYNTLSIDPADYMPLTKPRVVDIGIELPAGARKVYDRLVKELVIETAGKEIDVFSTMAAMTKQLQVASGFAYDENGATYPIHDEKMLALDELLEEIDAPTIVTYHYKAQLALLKARYPNAIELPGGAAQKDVEDRWNRGEIDILLLNPMSAGHGLNLQYGGCDMVCMNLTWDLEYYLQAIERIGPTRQAQAGLKRTVSIYRIYAKKTTDEQVLLRLDEKATLQQAVMEAVRGY